MKGRTWCISFKDEAKKDGDVTVKWKVIGADGRPQELPGTWEGYRKGMTAREKANRFYEQLTTTYAGLVGATRAGNLVCFQLKDEAPYRDLAGVEIGDETGQTFDVYDEAARPYVETVRFRLEGVPTTPASQVRLGVGHLAPLASVPTHRDGRPLALPEILQALVETFNAIYTPLGWTASVQDDSVVVPAVPCEEGAAGGTDDTGLRYWLAIADPDLDPFRRGFDKAAVLSGRLDEIIRRLTTVEADVAALQARLPRAGPRVSQCVGQGFIDIVEGRRVIGDLTCAGVCADGTRCTVQENADKTRQWCGCPGEPEPTECHLVKLKLPSGEWAFDCAGPCPQPQDMCTPQARRIRPTRLVVSCECITPEP